MAFRLYYTDYDVSPAEYEANRPFYIPFVYYDRDDALRRARQIIDIVNGVPWEIVGDDGTTLDRVGIAKELRARSRELAGAPKVY